MSRAAVVALAALLMAPLRAGSEPETPVFGVSTDLVNVTVTVTDERGRLIRDLQPSDFTLEEDGRRQEIQLFAAPDDEGAAAEAQEALGINLGMLFDTSGSMLDDLRLSQQAAIRLLDSVPRARELVTVFFGDDIRISRYDSETQQGLFERILDSEGSGNTALYDALAAYLSRPGTEGGRRVAVLFTDGDDTLSGLSRADSIALLKSENVTVYSVAFDADRPGSSRTLRAHAYLNETASLTGGRVFHPQSYRDLPRIYDEIIDELGAQYVLGFATDKPSTDGKLRRLKVTVKRPGLRVRYRMTYQPEPRSSP